MTTKKTTKKTSKRPPKKKAAKKPASKKRKSRSGNVIQMPGTGVTKTTKTTKATKAKATKSTRPPKQAEIPGTERVQDEELSVIAEQLYDTQKREREAKNEADGLRDLLLAAMKKRELLVYEDPERDIRVVYKKGKDKVVVKSMPLTRSVD